VLENYIHSRYLPRTNFFVNLQEFREPKLDSQVVTKFLPALMSLMADDQVRSLNAKLPPDERESAITIIEHSGQETCE
jgi:negative elongation factor B